MACINCAKIRSLVLHGKMAEAAGLTVETLREKIGFKPEPVESTVEGLRTTVVIDAESDHRQQGTGPLALSIPDLVDHLQTMTDPQAVETLLVGERAGRARAGALAALESRRDALLAG